MTENQHITIHIAGQSPFGLDIPRDRRAWARDVEAKINKLWAGWCNDFPNKSPQEVLAMVTFQYARHYYDLLERIHTEESALKDFEARLDEILLDVK